MEVIEKKYRGRECSKCKNCGYESTTCNVKIHIASCENKQEDYLHYCVKCHQAFWYYRAFQQHCMQESSCADQEKHYLFMCRCCEYAYTAKASHDRHRKKSVRQPKYSRNQPNIFVCKFETILLLILKY
jgi:hypothetical protein